MEWTEMDESSESFLYQLLTTPSPTGSEQHVQRLLKRRLERCAERVETDVHGNLYLELNTKAKRAIMLAGHCDQIGFIITEIGTDGFLYVEPLGGLDEGVVQGSFVTVHTKGGPVDGVFGRKAIHLQTPQERQQVPTLKNMWIDIGARDKADAERYVAPGDYVTYRRGVTELRNGFISSPGLDNRAGLFVVAEAFRRCHEVDMKIGLVMVSTVQEEVGMRGAGTAAFSLRPEVPIAV